MIGNVSSTTKIYFIIIIIGDLRFIVMQIQKNGLMFDFSCQDGFKNIAVIYLCIVASSPYELQNL